MVWGLSWSVNSNWWPSNFVFLEVWPVGLKDNMPRCTLGMNDWSFHPWRACAVYPSFDISNSDQKLVSILDPAGRDLLRQQATLQSSALRSHILDNVWSFQSKQYKLENQIQILNTLADKTIIYNRLQPGDIPVLGVALKINQSTYSPPLPSHTRQWMKNSGTIISMPFQSLVVFLVYPELHEPLLPNPQVIQLFFLWCFCQ